MRSTEGQPQIWGERPAHPRCLGHTGDHPVQGGMGLKVRMKKYVSRWPGVYQARSRKELTQQHRGRPAGKGGPRLESGALTVNSPSSETKLSQDDTRGSWCLNGSCTYNGLC